MFEASASFSSVILRYFRHFRIRVGVKTGRCVPVGSGIFAFCEFSTEGPCSGAKNFACAEILDGLKVSAMKLAEYLKLHGIKRRDFAGRIGVSNGWITQLCEGGGWPSKQVAERIAAETGGKVTADDFGDFAEAARG